MINVEPFQTVPNEHNQFRLATPRLKPGVNETLALNTARQLQIAAFFQVRECFPHHAVTEMSLSHA